MDTPTNLNEGVTEGIPPDELDRAFLLDFCQRAWDEEIVPQLEEYIRIPAKSPHFDANWAENGHLDRAVELIERWCRGRTIEGLSVEVVRLEGRTPVIYMEVPGEGDDTVLLYGHMDKQPEMVGWREGLGPWIPVREGDRLYGRGGADDGYSAFASLTAIEALQAAGGRHARCAILIEACEESGSYDLPFYIDHLAARIGTPSLVVCLDSGAGNYDQLWNTTSLRGMAMGTLRVEILKEGVHSGDASGVVPSSFRIARMLLDRLEDPQTGRVSHPAFQARIPEGRREQARIAAEALGDRLHLRFPFVEGAGAVPLHDRPGCGLEEVVLARTWYASLSVTGADGLPAARDAGNVLRPATSLKLSLRLPPTCDSAQATRTMKELLEADPPYGARVVFDGDEESDGWNAPPVAPWLADAVERASRDQFGAPAISMGEGGTIPFMGMLGEKFPEAQFLITGVLGPESNAHGPNEFLHVPTGIKLTACVAEVLAEHLVR